MKDFNKYLFLFLLASASIVTLVALSIGDNFNYVSEKDNLTASIGQLIRPSFKEGDSCIVEEYPSQYCVGKKVIQCINGKMALIKTCLSQEDCLSLQQNGLYGGICQKIKNYIGYCDESQKPFFCSNNSVILCMYDQNGIRHATEFENCTEGGKVCKDIFVRESSMPICEVIDPKDGDECRIFSESLRCNKNNEFCTCSNGEYICSLCPGNNTCIEGQGCVNLVGNGNNCSKAQEGKLACNATADTVCKCSNSKWKCDRPCGLDQVCNDSIKTYCVSKGGGGGACKGGKNCDFTQ